MSDQKSGMPCFSHGIVSCGECFPTEDIEGKLSLEEWKYLTMSEKDSIVHPGNIAGKAKRIVADAEREARQVELSGKMTVACWEHLARGGTPNCEICDEAQRVLNEHRRNPSALLTGKITEGFDRLPHGIYRIHWKSGDFSLAAVGSMHSGKRWMAPVNWTEDEESGRAPGGFGDVWKMVEYVESVL